MYHTAWEQINDYWRCTDGSHCKEDLQGHIVTTDTPEVAFLLTMRYVQAELRKIKLDRPESNKP